MRKKNLVKDVDDESYSQKTNSIISNSDDEQNEKDRKIKSDETEIVQRIQMLQEKIRTKDKLIEKLKSAMIQDDKIKSEMMYKINEMKSNMNHLKENMENIDDFDDDELNDLLNKIDHKEDMTESSNEFSDADRLKVLNINPSGQNILGNAMMNDYQLRIFLKEANTCFSKLKIFLNQIFIFFIPFKSDMKYLFARHDRNISSMFLFFRFLYIFNIFVFLTSSYLLVNHILIYNKSDHSADQTFCKVFLPCSIFYSRFSAEEKNTYSFTFMAICVVMFICIIYNWTSYKRHDFLQELFDSQNINFSKEVFNLWDWHVNSLDKEDDIKTRVKNVFTIGLIETEIKENIKNRSSKDKFYLFLRRIFSLFFSAIILLLDAAMVTGLYYLQAYLFFRDTDKTTNSFTDYVALTIPSVGLLIINAIIQILLELCIKLEKWDFNSTYIIQSIWRNYIAKLFTQMVVYSLIIIFLILEKTSSEVFNTDNLNFNLKLTCSSNVTSITDPTLITSLGLTKRSYSNYANCKEDQAASTFLINLLIDFFVRKIIPPIILLIRFLIFRKIKKQRNFKKSYDNIISVVGILLFNIQIYSLIPFFPFVLLISPILLYLDFKYEVFSLKYIYDKPEKLTMQDKSGSFIMTLFTFTILAIIVIFILFFVNSISHNNFMECYTDASGKVYEYYNSKFLCGPFADEEKLNTTLYESIISNSILSAIYNFFANPVYLFIILVLFIIIILYNLQVSNAFNFYVKGKKKEMISVENSMNEIIKKLRDQVKLLKYGVKEIKN